LEVCFVDVGQGSSNLILLGRKRAIVIDAGGRQSGTVIRLLQHFQIESLTRLIVTHNHDDHSRGAANLLTAYSRRIEEVWFLHDDVLRRSLFWQRITEEVQRGNLTRDQLLRLERGRAPVTVYQDGKVYLDILAPDFIQNVQAVEDRNANSTSGILLLGGGPCRVIFTGDSTIPEWRGVMDPQRRKRPFTCDILTVPHHAGAVWERQQPGETEVAYRARIGTSLDWLYSSAVRATLGVVSVGTNNQFRHPRPEVMEALRRASVVPVCTQMTRQCTPDLEAQRARSLPMVLPSRSVSRRDVNESGRSRNVACAGTLLVEVQAGGYVVHRYADHQDLIDNLVTAHGVTPLCRPPGAIAPAVAAS
jgi:beta-lactamase superfamily II metal-dependent hydrolase